MQRAEVQPDTIERLSKLDTGGHPVLSVYLDLDPTEFATPAARESQLRGLLTEARHRAERENGNRMHEIEADAKLIERSLMSDPDAMRGAHALAIFSAAGIDLLEVYALPDPVTPMAIVDDSPWLEPLAAYFSRNRYAVAVVSRARARLYVGDASGLHEFGRIEDEVHRRHKQGGWSQANYQRSVEEDVNDHLGNVAHDLTRAHKRRQFDGLFIVAAEELLPAFEQKLDSELRQKTLGHVKSDLDHAGAEEVLKAVRPQIEKLQVEHERALFEQLHESLGKNGRAAASLFEVLPALEQERVATLMILENARLKAQQCRTCGRISAPDAARCEYDDGELEPIDAVQHAIELAMRQSSDVALIRYQREELERHGSIAALLRW